MTEWRVGSRATRSVTVAVASMLFGVAGARAEVAGSPAAQASPPMVTRVLAIGTLTPSATPTSLSEVLKGEVPATLRLYLSGKIADWYAKADQTGVVFVLNATTVEEARALLDPLPLGQAGLMTFQFIPIGPLRPLGTLLQQPKK